MQKNSNRRGLALAAIVSLFTSAFVGLPAQAATDGANIGAYPVAGSTSAAPLTGLLAEDFPVYVQLKPGNSSNDFTSNFLTFKVEKTAGTAMDVAVSASATATDMTAVTSASNTASFSKVIAAGSTSETVSGIVSNGVAHLNFKASSASGTASWSSVTLKVTAWIDSQGGARNDVIDSDEWFTTFNVSLLKGSSVTPTIALTSPNEADTTVTVSATVTGINTANLSGRFFLAMSSSSVLYTAGAASTLVVNELTGAQVADRAGLVSSSITVASISKSQSVSASLRYTTGTSVADIYAGELLGAVTSKAATGATITDLVLTVVESDDATASGQAVPVRPNKSYTVKVHAATNSVSVSGTVVSVSLAGSDALTLGTSAISINGGAATTSYPTALSLTTGTDGFASFTIATTGVASGHVIKVNAKSGNEAATELVLTATTPTYKIVNDYDNYLTAPGTAVNITYEVEDQWQVLSARTDQRLKLTRGGTGFAYAETVSTVVVTNGKATFAFTPSPATKTGSATVNAVLERFDADLNAWVSGGSAAGAVTVNVSSTTDAFSVSPALSKSASVSYFPSTVSWVTFTGTVKNAGASVEVSGADNLVFRAASGKATASAKLVVRADASGNFTFDVASLKAKSHTISVKVGASVTTSQLVVDAPSSDLGKTITFDTSSLTPGSTKVITGTLVDANGNAVNTSGSATIEVTYVPTGNAGIPIGTMPTETDADGKFTFTVLTGANDSGTAKITAVYLKSGASTATADKLTFTQTVTVAAPAPVTPPAADQKLTVGSFNGYVAIYAKGYAGKKLSAKVAGKWLTVASLSDFQRVVRNTGAGYTIKVDLYIDGSLVKSETVTTK